MKKKRNLRNWQRRRRAEHRPLVSPTAMGRFIMVIGLLAAVLGTTPQQASAQFLGHNLPGDFGLQSGTQPDPGLYLALAYVNYESDTLRDRNGNSVSLDPNTGQIALNVDDPDSLSVNGYAVGVWKVTDYKLFGGNYGFMIVPAFTDNKLEAPILGQVNETSFGLTDLYVQPVNIGWHTERADFITGLGVYAPTGSYDPNASDNRGLGMWSFEIAAGATVYFDKEKTWHFATTAFYEIHTEKEDTDIRVGDILTLEGGLGKSFMGGAVSVGVSYYAQWKITDDDLGYEIEQQLGGYKPGKHRGFGVGPEITVPIATKSKLIALLNARYFWETGVRSNLEGNMFVATLTFPIPSVPLK